MPTTHHTASYGNIASAFWEVHGGILYDKRFPAVRIKWGTPIEFVSVKLTTRDRVASHLVMAAFGLLERDSEYIFSEN